MIVFLYVKKSKNQILIYFNKKSLWLLTLTEHQLETSNAVNMYIDFFLHLSPNYSTDCNVSGLFVQVVNGVDDNLDLFFKYCCRSRVEQGSQVSHIIQQSVATANNSAEKPQVCCICPLICEVRSISWIIWHVSV